MAADSKDGLIDLENLVRDIEAPEGSTAAAAAGDKATSNSSAAPNSAAGRLADSTEERKASSVTAAVPPEKSGAIAFTQPASGPAGENISSSEKSKLSDEEFDSILIMEAPELAAEFSAIREIAKSPLEGGGPSDDIDDVLAAEKDSTFLTKFRRRLNVVFLKLIALIAGLKAFALRSVRDSKGLIRELFEKAKVSLRTSVIERKAQLAVGWNWFTSRTLGQRLSIVAALATMSFTAFVIYRMSQGTLLPKTQREWIASFTDVADGVFHYEANESFEDFNDPVHHPEFVVAVERIVVNLRRSSDASPNSNPMAAFEFFVQADSQSGAIEVKDRNVEIRDQIARAIEQLTYSELSTEEGKSRLKLLLRKELNEIMTKGRIRRVYFKTIVLNPE
jgi:flagellar basal body-associated protein FliL